MCRETATVRDKDHLECNNSRDNQNKIRSDKKYMALMPIHTPLSNHLMTMNMYLYSSVLTTRSLFLIVCKKFIIISHRIRIIFQY